MPTFPDIERLRRGYHTVRDALLSERDSSGYWLGELSTSALSTATAMMALIQVRHAGRWPDRDGEFHRLIEGGQAWLLSHQNEDGGWGDTVKSFSNISTTMLCQAVLVARHPDTDQRDPRVADAIKRAGVYIDEAGGVPALIARYGQDKTFSIPILTHCALAGLIEWNRIPPLPFELACLPARFYKTVRLPVVSYALPALIAIGQVRHHFAPPRNPITRLLRNLSIAGSLKKLEQIQPVNGGFLEATPLTSFVTMSLTAKGLAGHPVVAKGIDFIVNSVQPDGSWPIDTNLATWVTTLSVNALAEDLTKESRRPILNWLLGQQWTEVHPYTNADPGGWSWTDLPGGVPDADDTPGAMLALMSGREATDPEWEKPIQAAVRHAVRWLLGVQNRDGGFPTFCRGWGKLPFDRSSPDITAHCLRGLGSWLPAEQFRLAVRGESDRRGLSKRSRLAHACVRSIQRGMRFLHHCQSPDGAWHPLWFGNQHTSQESNPTYGTAKVLAVFRDAALLDHASAQRGLAWLRENQNQDGGWGAGLGTPSSIEETALATEILLDDPHANGQVMRGLNWLLMQIDDGTVAEPSPIGFYFAKLWYFERLYPLIFTVSCLRRAVLRFEQQPSPG